MIGSTDANAAVIQQSYEQVLDILQSHFARHDFFFGERPGRTDFGLFGQLTPMLWWDPTPTAVAVERAPRTLMWIQWMDDLSWWRLPGDDATDPSGSDAGWFDASAIPETTIALLKEAGRTYAPFMVANARALQANADEAICEIDGQRYSQAPFKYQGKCLQWIRGRYSVLTEDNKERVDQILSGTGCERLLTAALG